MRRGSRSGLQKFEILVHVFSCNNIFAHTIVHLTFCAPQIVIRASVHTNVYLAVHLLERQKYFRAEVNLGQFHSPSIHNLVWVSKLFITEKKTTDIFSDISLDNIFFWVSEEKKELSPSQILYNKLKIVISLHL